MPLPTNQLLAKEKETHKLKYKCMVTAVCLLLWALLHLVFALMPTGVLLPHVYAFAGRYILHYTSELIIADAHLAALRRDLAHRLVFVNRTLTMKDRLEVFADGMSVGLAICGVVEGANFALGVHSAGTE